jgi:hypothetical protein
MSVGGTLLSATVIRILIIMSKQTIKYKDTKVAPGTQLYAAIEAGDTKAAEKIYKECHKEWRKHNLKRIWSIEDQEALLAERQILLGRLLDGFIVRCERDRLEIVCEALDDIKDLKVESTYENQ